MAVNGQVLDRDRVATVDRDHIDAGRVAGDKVDDIRYAALKTLLSRPFASW